MRYSSLVVRRSHIVAVGGGRPATFSAIDAYVLGLSEAATPRVCFLPTASGDDGGQLDSFYSAYEGRASAVHLSLFRRSRRDLAATMAGADVVILGGGNAANALALFRLHGVDTLLRKAADAGAVVAGFSAGASCLFERSVSDSFGPKLAALDDGLGLVEGSFCAHYSDGPRRAPRFRELLAGGFPPGFGVDDGAALHFVDGRLDAALSWRDEANAFHVDERVTKIDAKEVSAP